MVTEVLNQQSGHLINTISNYKQLLAHFMTRIVDDATNTNMLLRFIKVWAH